jgi:DNA-binding MarR family transcriptional regulator
MKAYETTDLDCAYPDALIACPDFLLSTLAMSVTELIEDALAPLDLRLRHYRLLRLLFADGPQQQGNLASALQTDRTTVVSLVDHLERKKLAKRGRSVDDRRAYTVTLTAKGRELAKRAIGLTAELERRMFAPLERDEQDTLRRLSTRLLAAPGPIAAAHGALARDSDRAPIRPTRAVPS